MTNVLPTKEQKRVWAFYRTRFILACSLSFLILAGIVLIALIPSYVILIRNRPITGEGSSKNATTAQNQRSDAFKTQQQIAQIYPIVSVTTSPMDEITRALNGRPAGVSVDRINYTADADTVTIALGGSAQTRDGISALQKELGAKGIYTSVTIPVSDLVGATGNQFTVTLVSTIK